MKHSQLIYKLTKREILSRNKGSILGLGWTLVHPMVMLLIYTIVFSEIFNMRWGGIEDSKSMFAIMLFSGLALLTFFCEVLTRSTSLVTSNANFVKKVIFPIEILSIVSVGAALFQLLVSLFILLLAILLVQGSLASTTLLLPLVLFPLVILSMGFSWFIAAVGVYFKDMSQLVAVLSSLLVFLSPVFYPISAVPGTLKPFILLNPLTFIIEQMRNILVRAQQPDWMGLAIYTFLALVIAWLGFQFFQKLRRGYADVV